MWLGEQITEGSGNGISLIIFTSIISRAPIAVMTFTLAFGQAGQSAFAAGNICIYGSLIAGVIFIDQGREEFRYNIPKRVGRKMYGGQSTHIPMKVNSSGVLPIIFAVSILAVPQTIAQFMSPTSGFVAWVDKWFSQDSALYAVIYALLIIFFTYFYTQISFNPVEISNNLKQYGGFVQGIKPSRLFRIPGPDFQPVNTGRSIVPGIGGNYTYSSNCYNQGAHVLWRNSRSDSSRCCAGNLEGTGISDAHASLQGFLEIRKSYDCIKVKHRAGNNAGGWQNYRRCPVRCAGTNTARGYHRLFEQGWLRNIY